jgi:alkyl hydroperoxide reductase subunit AhpF
MYKGIRRGDISPYILKDEHTRMPIDDGKPKEANELPTIWLLRAQNTEAGNRNIVAYTKARSQEADDAIAALWTNADLNQFLDAVAGVRNFCFRDEETPRKLIEAPEELKRVFAESDMNIVAELLNASKSGFALREAERFVLSSSFGRDLLGNIPAGSNSTASGASKTVADEPPTA